MSTLLMLALVGSAVSAPVVDYDKKVIKFSASTSAGTVSAEDGDCATKCDNVQPSQINQMVACRWCAGLQPAMCACVCNAFSASRHF